MILVEQAPQRASIVTRGRNWARGVQVSGLVVAVAALVVLGVWWVQRGTASPDDVTRDFLDSTSCSQLYDLATDSGDELLGGGGCDAMIRAAQGDRTYADQKARALTRTLHIGAPLVEGRHAQVHVDVTYGGHAAPETLVVMLTKVGNDWQVNDWGLPAS